MSVEDILQEIREEVRAILPASIRVTDIDFEGAQLVIYTKDPDKFADNSDLVRQLAKKIQHRGGGKKDTGDFARGGKYSKYVF